ncbi:MULTISPECIES: 4-hydroxy-tetrahydrodipicolinate synthase [Thermodesulfovibrio]|jgi:4-hydroxy-tetrahydrodipicolinate synthase|uniref:4-hydroxy-tetrahydrodipicolinate synthase n=1 Tax=Thermodesulfovibrio TaxID=28261 RepID=UPI002615FFB8|nr:4-hydroxy-tetrahydrodipicolinate synthase [Thermodesulfovibrio sp.]
MLKGSMVAIVTPFKKGKVDEKTLEKLIEWHIKEGTHAIVPCGTTGEASTLDYEEHYRVIEITVKTVNKRIPVIAGTGSNSTDEAIMITKKAEQLGADAVLSVTPYYNKPTQEGLYRHFKEIADKTGLPIILYNVPGRTSLNMLPQTVARLREHKRIVGIKEATGDMKQVSEIIRLCGRDFTVLSGDDFTNLTLLTLGGRGFISVTANICPKDVSELFNAWERGEIEKAREIHYKLEPINKAMFIETNPIPVKTALALMGKIKEEFRLPLCEMSSANKEKLAEVLRVAGLIK